MKSVYVLLLLLLGFASTAQTQWNQIRVTVIEVAHNYQCCTDAGGLSCNFLKNRPEPQYEINGRYGTASGLTGYYTRKIDLGSVGLRHFKPKRYSHVTYKY